jgi:hypothetical protein
VVGVAVVAVALCALIGLYVRSLVSSPAAVAGAAEQGSARLTLQTVGAIGPRYPNPDWVSYLAREPDGRWVRSTDLTAPAHSLMRGTIYTVSAKPGLLVGASPGSRDCCLEHALQTRLFRRLLVDGGRCRSSWGGGMMEVIVERAAAGQHRAAGRPPPSPKEQRRRLKIKPLPPNSGHEPPTTSFRGK